MLYYYGYIKIEGFKMDIKELYKRIDNIHDSELTLRLQIDKLNDRVVKESNEVKRLKREVFKTLNHKLLL